MTTSIGMGSVIVRTNAQPSAEEYTERMMAKIIHISETAPEELKLQVKAFRVQLHDLILASVREIMENN